MTAIYKTCISLLHYLPCGIDHSTLSSFNKGHPRARAKMNLKFLAENWWMNGVRLMFYHLLQRLKINCFTRCTVHTLFSNTHPTHVIVIGCDILLLCTSIVKLLLLARCFSGSKFHNYRQNGKQKLWRVLVKTSFLLLAKGLLAASRMPWYHTETDRIREQYQSASELIVCMLQGIYCEAKKTGNWQSSFTV